MTNFEFYEKEVKAIVEQGAPLALIDGKPANCHEIIDCKTCDFRKQREGCSNLIVRWLYEEYIEPPKINVRTKRFFRIIRTGYVVRGGNNLLYYFSEKPYREMGTWTCSAGIMEKLDFYGFLSLDFITSMDKSPWSVEDILKLKGLDES